MMNDTEGQHKSEFLTINHMPMQSIQPQGETGTSEMFTRMIELLKNKQI